ncbi:hypothetical protein [Abyssogena phaseoliformis symbiont]|uniref:hypothetical protein n=1 Tax=Abyssogena phaseoliformis symbiont TaxID=596095 RepID=UPI001CEC30E6|nr:hypothetical protein [Abyssogena phaseoliformis symbiont]
MTRAMISSQDPLSELQNTGHSLIVNSTAAYLAVASISSKAALNATVLGTSVGGVASLLIPDVDMIISFFQSIIIFTFAIGILFAYYLPLIPLITWVGAVVGYLMFLFEAFIGSIFWVGAHEMPEGHGARKQVNTQNRGIC